MTFSRNFIVYAVALCFLIVGCGQDQERPSESLTGEEQTINDHGSKVLEEAKGNVTDVKESAAKHAEEITAKGSDVLKELKSEGEEIKKKTSSAVGEHIDKAKALFKEEVVEKPITGLSNKIEAVTQNQTDEVTDKVDSMTDETSSTKEGLIEKAQTLLDQGKYKESIAAAQEVLSNYDSDSPEAMDIISKAKEKLKGLVTEKAKAEIEAATSEKVEALGNSISNILNEDGE